MGLEHAHKGYEYQDLLSALFIIEHLLKDVNATVKIDKKESANDKFDDITIMFQSKTIKRQIKYSEDKVLAKADFSSATYDLALDILFKSWKETVGSKNIDLRICLAWEYIESNEELDFLKTIDCENIYNDDNVKFLKIDIDKIWANGQLPISTWRRLRSQNHNIDREEFASFLNDLIIETNLPKASHDISNPADLEKLVLLKLKQFGVGKYPNHLKAVGDVLLNLTHIIKSSRANGEEVSLNRIVYKLGLKSGFGNIQQNFDIDEDMNVINEDRYHSFYNFVFVNRKTMLIGEPGAGKSWFIQNYIKFLKKKDINVVQHYCYTALDDIYEKERITINVFLANLINDIIDTYPALSTYKSTKYGVDIDELQTLIDNVKEDTVLIIDGLDHISRIYNFHRTLINEVETEIIKVLSKLEFPENFHVILASQPVTEVINLSDQGYKIFNIEPWDRSDVEKLLLKSNIENRSINRDTTLSDILLNKSNGNPLYLTYLINEIKRYNSFLLSVELFENFPPYNGDLSNYYDYIMTQIPESHKVPQVLAGAPFYLTEEDLREITFLGQYVGQSLEAIQSILKINVCNGGYTIYHESFRRYILETLERKEVNVEKIIYDDLIEWLKRKGFYQNRKSYLNLFILLFESKRYEEILSYCNKEFVVDSIFFGNNVSSLKNNFELLIKTACMMKDYGALIVCTELSNMIYSLEYSFDENSELYYMGLGLINGYSSLKETLMYEGNMALDLKQGLRVCYLCSKNSIVPEWEPYIDQLIQARTTSSQNHSSDDEKELYRYYICACIDLDWEMVERLSKICAEEAGDYRKIVIEEYSRRNELNKLTMLIDEISINEYWKKSIATYTGRIEIDENLVTKTFSCLEVADSYSVATMSSLIFYIENIKWLLENRSNELDAFLETIKDRNWFYNWIRYIAEVNRVLLDLGNIEFDTKLSNAYLWLTNDLEPFKGTPRTCDLYKYESIIYATIKAPLNYIKTKDTWEIILETIKLMSEETTTLLQGSTGGPLPTYKLLNLFMDSANQDNIEIILEIISKKIGKEDKYRFYSYLADYSFKHAIILSKAGKEDISQKEFKQGVKYLLSYSFRKDRTLSHLLDSVLTTYKLDNEIGLKNILKLKPLADAVVHHTDGKSTKRYQNEWFQLLVKTRIDLAVTYLRNELALHVNHWILEDSLESLLIACNSEMAPIIESVLFKTIPNNISEDFIEAYVKNIEWLFENNLYLPARRSLAELMSRFDAQDQMNYMNHNLIVRLKELCHSFDIEWNEKIQSKRKRSLNGSVSVTPSLYVHRKNFDEFTHAELLDYLNENGARREDSKGIFYYLSIRIKDLNYETKAFLSGIVKSCFEKRTNDPSSNRLLEIVNNLNLNDEVMAFLYMQMFLLHTDGWYHKFTEIEFFRKAHEYNSNVAKELFFEYIYNNLSTVDYSLAVGGEIINSLAVINYDKKLILEYWDRLFDIINFRLSGQIDYDWDAVKSQTELFDNEEKLFSLLLSRFKYGEANRYKWIISEMNLLLEDKVNREKFVKPFVQFIQEKDNYIDYSLVLLLFLICKQYKFEELVQTLMKDALEQIYPTKNMVTNFLIRAVIHKETKNIYCEYRKNHSSYNERTHYFLDRIKRIDSKVTLLEEYGLDVECVIQDYTHKIFTESFVKEYREILFNRMYHVLIPNVYFYDLLTSQIGMEVEKFLKNYSGTPFFNEIEGEIYKIALDDISLIVAQQTSIIPRPQDLVLPQFAKEGVTEVEVSDWVRIAHSEKWFNKLEKYKENFGENTEAITVLSGVGFGAESPMVPFIKLGEEYSFLEENEEFPIFPGYFNKLEVFLTSNISLYSDPYLTFNTKQYLGIRGGVLQNLGINMIDTGCGIVGILEDGEEVLKYFRWEVGFSDTENNSDKIPYLIGSQLLMKYTKFNELCSLVQKKPLLYTTVFDPFSN
ncbi:ATP-binding protein [Paenibacillus sp. SYP-B3998]|uniref:ATP-binding protein n=1 Tax=Paenibacillus sp. SYP-B3998 TaxID=2678564 RepID=A0A6G4A4P1_9BACL|nr:ATP-binding protein [Paenibacillus sp. SYP-B3998]NEW08617.1 ATP-binding protein [Paenibacillus sp. SYP-B3998]